MNFNPNSLQDIIDRAVEIANDAGRRGRKVRVIWIPPQTALVDGVFAVEDITPQTAAEGW